MKVSELEGADLDYWVAKAIGPNWYSHFGRLTAIGYGGHPFCPSRKWGDCGPLIEGYKISLLRPISNLSWEANIGTNYRHNGNTPLEAACRAIVASIYGDYVPEE